MSVGDRTHNALRSSYHQIPLRARRRALSATCCSSWAAIQDRSTTLSKLANGAVDPLVTMMYRLRRNPRLRKFVIDARNRNIFVTSINMSAC